MARFNTRSHRAQPPVAKATGPVVTVSRTPDTRTFEGALGWTRTAKGQLFLQAAGAFHGGEDTFYEDGDKRDDRLRDLVREIVREDYPWLVDFATWLRGPGNMRTASLMIACEAVHEDLIWLREVLASEGSMSTPYTNDGLNRRIINTVCQRADEPGELLAIWTAWFGRNIPKPVKRGIADAVRRLYTERALLKYDTSSHAYRFGDVLNLVHAAPDPAKPWQGELFQHALDRRHHPDDAAVPESLRMVKNNITLRGQGAVGDFSQLASPGALRNAGMTWEDVLSLHGQYAQSAEKVGWNKRAVWESMIPSMGIMAQIRNLRNFDEAGVSDTIAQLVIDRLTDPQEIAQSRQLPFRFHTAYRETPSLRWGHALDKALTASLSNIPELPGRTLIMVDTSSSMEDRMSSRSTVLRWDVATLFGVALAHRCESADVVSFSSARQYLGDPPGAKTKVFPLKKGESVLRSIERWRADGFFLGGGTDTALAVRQHFAGHDRLVIITDEQVSSSGDPGEVIPQHVPMYTWNLAGYSAGHSPSGSDCRFTIGGLTDQAFRLIPLIEQGSRGLWPWQTLATA